MRRALVLVMLSACVHEPSLTAAEFCGARGTVFSGTTTTNTEDSGAVFVNGTVVPVVSRGSAESVSCRVPATPKDECQIKAASLSRDRKESYDTLGRNLLLGVGWVTFIVPGLAMYIVFSGQRNDASNEANLIFEQTYADCMKTVH